MGDYGGTHTTHNSNQQTKKRIQQTTEGGQIQFFNNRNAQGMIDNLEQQQQNMSA
tara:strand:+ start:1856 stop:2020 length:165 start_codon:yes stop_codon:yes gene_type:complete